MIKATLFEGMPRSDYDQLAGMRKSLLWHGAKSMRNLRHAMDHPFESTPQQNLGSAVHTLCLEPDKFHDEFAVMVKADGRTKEGKAAKAAFAAESAGKTIIDDETFDVAHKMAWELGKIPELSDLLNSPDGMVEAAIQWQDPHTGVLCKCRMDFFLPDDNLPVILDLKTTRDASDRAFQGAIATFGYHVQGAMYSDAVELLTGERPIFLLFAVESSPPFHVSYGYLDDTALRIGRDKYRELLEQYWDCMDADNWPGYPAEFQRWSLPRWAE